MKSTSRPLPTFGLMKGGAWKPAGVGITVPLEWSGHSIGDLRLAAVRAERAAAASVAERLVEDAEAAANHGLCAELVGEAGPRTDAGKVGRPEARHTRPARTRSREYQRAGIIVGRRIGKREVDRGHEGRIPVDRDVVTQPQVQRQLRSHLPVVLKVERVILILDSVLLHR